MANGCDFDGPFQGKVVRLTLDATAEVERRRAALSPVIDALTTAISELPDGEEWKWACLGIRRHMVESAELPLMLGVVPVQET